MANVNVTENHLTFGGVKYFRGKAESVMIGDFGDKKTPITGQNYLSIQDNLPAPKIKVSRATVAAIDFKKSKKADVKAGLKVAGWSGSAEAAYKGLKSGDLKLVKLEMQLGEVRDAFNRSPKALDNLASCGKDGRVAHEIFVVMKASMASEFTAGGKIEASKSGGSLGLSVGGSGSHKVTVGKGTTFAYLLCKPDWKGLGKKEIKKFKDDQWSFS